MRRPRTAHPALGDRGARIISRRYHFHLPGMAYLLTTVVLFIGAANAQNNLLFWLFGLAAAGFVASGFVSGAILMAVRASREPPPPAQVGQPSIARYRVRSGSRFAPLLALTIEELPDHTGPTSRGAMTYGRAFVAHVPAGGEATVHATWTGTKRGIVQLRRFRVWTTFPLGLVKKSVTFEQPATLRVRPHVAQVHLPPHALPGARHAARDARWPSRSGQEFHSLREYTPGDSARRITWRPSARRDTPLVRENSERRSESLVLCPVESADPARTEQVISAVAGVALAAIRAGSDVALAIQPPVPLSRDPALILDALAAWGQPSPQHQPQSSTTPPAGVHSAGAPTLSIYADRAPASGDLARAISLDELGLTASAPVPGPDATPQRRSARSLAWLRRNVWGEG